jgi:hypothetical protein
MGQNEKVEKAPKTSWFSGLKAEFQKIIWPEKQLQMSKTAFSLPSLNHLSKRYPLPHSVCMHASPHAFISLFLRFLMCTITVFFAL